MSPAEREARAQEILNQATQRIAIEYGFEAKQRLMFQTVSDNYTVVQSALYLSPLAGWVPPPDVAYQPKAVNPVVLDDEPIYEDGMGYHIGDTAREIAEHVIKGMNGASG